MTQTDRNAIADQPTKIYPHDKALLTAMSLGCNSYEAALVVRRARGTIMNDLERLRSTFRAKNTTHLVSMAIREGLI